MGSDPFLPTIAPKEAPWPGRCQSMRAPRHTVNWGGNPGDRKFEPSLLDGNPTDSQVCWIRSLSPFDGLCASISQVLDVKCDVGYGPGLVHRQFYDVQATTLRKKLVVICHHASRASNLVLIVDDFIPQRLDIIACPIV